VDEDGVQRRWRWSPEAVDRDTSQFMVKPGTRGEKVVYYKYRPRFDGVTVTTVWADPKYSATEHGTGVLKTLFPDYNVFSFPKSIYAVEDCLRIAAPDCGGECCLDFFAGSGTTGHAVINLNREDGERRQFVLVEMADYFDTVTVPRIAKVMYCPEWRDGRPDGYPAKPLSEGEWPEWVERTPRLVKVIRLESYEDTLHNLVTADTLARAEERQKATKTIVGAPTYRLQYLLKLPAEASGSLLLSEKLEHPFRYELEILTDAGPEVRGVDVVETFNFLYGLDVDRVERWEGAGREYRAVRARNRAGRQVLVLWRDMAGLTDGEASLPAVVAEREFLEGKIAELKAAGWVPDDTLINGDCAVPGITSLDGEFRRRMDEPEQ
jgi:adenine-specific DNA-methyltransferase